jgi:ATP-dependent DNA helicase PIF1
MSLNEDQKHAFELFQQGQSIFITGPGGCGKSYLLTHIKDYCDQHLYNIGVTAMTGCAGSLIGGQTLHGWGGIGLAKESAPDLVRKLQKKPPLLRRWKSVKVLIIDEVSMMSMELFNKIHLIAQGIRKNDLFFGGIQVVLCGDFAQLDPIGSDKFSFESSIWKEHMDKNTVYLSQIIRQDDPVFQNILTNLRLGKLTKEDKDILNSRVTCDLTDSEVSVSDGDKELGKIKATLLYPLKKDVHRINNVELKKLVDQGNKSHTYNSMDFVVNRKSKAPAVLRSSHTDVLDKCTNSPPHLVLAVGAQVMLTKNKSVEEGLVNGSRGVVLEINELHCPIVMFDNGVQLTITPEAFEVESGDSLITRKQVPLILAWALTIHKCQGATLTNVITDLSDIFGYAQAYVTLSRVKSLEGLFIKSINYGKIACNPKVRTYYNSLAKSLK